MRKEIWMTILITALCIATVVGAWFLLEAMGQNPRDFIPVKPIGPIVPPPIRLPKI